MKDEYTSVEHIFLAFWTRQTENSKSCLKENGIEKNAVMKALVGIRGNTRVTGTNPEDTYDALKKIRH